jgi:hypothetical protein
MGFSEAVTTSQPAKVRDNLRDNIRVAIQKNVQKDECGWEGKGNLKDLIFRTIVGQAIGGAQFDLEVNLPFGCNEFAIVSHSSITDSVFLSPNATGRTNPGGGGAITFDGTEQWFPMNTVQNASTIYWAKLRFKGYLNVIYVSLGHESGAQNIVTIACSRDGGLELNGGMWT